MLNKCDDDGQEASSVCPFGVFVWILEFVYCFQIANFVYLLLCLNFSIRLHISIVCVCVSLFLVKIWIYRSRISSLCVFTYLYCVCMRAACGYVNVHIECKLHI